MTGKVEDAYPRETEQAMRRVLEAERDTNKNIYECEQQAKQILEQARERVRTITERANTRMSQMRSLCAHSLNAQIERLQEKCDLQVASIDTLKIGNEQLQDVVDTLAMELTTMHEHSDDNK